MFNKLKKAAKRQYARTKGVKTVGFTKEEADEILRQCQKVDPGRLQMMLYLMGLKGTRFDDIRQVERRDFQILPYVKEGQKTWEVKVTVRNGKTKAGADETVTFTNYTCDCTIKLPPAFKCYAMNYGKFSGKNGAFLPFEMTTQKANRLMRKAGCKGTTYGFRKHFAARAWIEEKGDVTKVAHRMAHASLKMARAFYLNIQGAAVEEEYKKHILKKEKADRV